MIKADNKRKSIPPSDSNVPLLVADNLGIKYDLSFRREDLQSLSYKLLDKKRRRKTDFWALRELSFNGYAGDIIGVIGSNGAGKTTLCRVIAGLIKPDSGSVRVEGKVTALFALGTGFNMELSGRENIYMNAMMLGLNHWQVVELIPRIADFSGLGRFIDEPLKSYSTGMRARLGFSIAAILEPEILVIDEALSAGDLEFSEKAAAKMKSLVKKAKLVIIVSHNTDFIEKHCNRVIWIDNGCLKESGPPDHIIPEYKKMIPLYQPTQNDEIELQKTISSASDRTTVITADKVSLCYYLRTNNNSSPGGYKIKKAPWHSKETFYALKDISLKVHKGEILGIVGPNGAGKTTLCRLITGILKADAGSLKINGDTTALLSFGTGFNIQLTGGDNIYLNGLMMGIPQKTLRNQYDQIVEFAEIGPYIDQPVKQYSRGMNTRLGFSIAAMLTPDIFIIDEALNAGDAAFYEKASYRIQKMISQAQAVIIVTHTLSFVEKVCTRAIWLENGRIILDGIPDEVTEAYRESYHRKEASRN